MESDNQFFFPFTTLVQKLQIILVYAKLDISLKYAQITVESNILFFLMLLILKYH
jgi:hypothetical protein